MTALALLVALTSIITNPRVAVTDGTDTGTRSHDAVVVDLKTASAQFVKAGTALPAKDRSIIVELLEPPVGPLANTSGLPTAFERPGMEKLFDNERVTVWRYTWAPHKKTPLHFHPTDVVSVFTTDGKLTSITPDGKTVTNAVSFGLARFNARGRIHQEQLVDGKASGVLVELK